jgi:hypothetical protein
VAETFIALLLVAGALYGELHKRRSKKELCSIIVRFMYICAVDFRLSSTFYYGSRLDVG